jgi:CMP-N-acetylneuraminic acid synthetase
MKVLAIIPARGGSKGVPGKNIRLVHGKPLIAWTIECALASRGLERIVVSSDDDAILAVVQGYAGILARKRPPELARDDTPIVPVIAHALAREEADGGGPYDAILLLQPTAPMREPLHVEQALAALGDGVNAVISVCAMRDMHPARMYRMDDDGALSPMIPAYEQARRQDIPPAWYRNGSIYLVRRSAFDAQGAVMAKPAFGYAMDQRYLLNIDEPRDMLVAEALVPAWRQGRL